MLLFSGIMVIVGLAMWRGISGLRRSGSFSASRCLSVGFAVGLLTGFLGIGGGFLIVPSLVLFAGLDSRMAAGTSLAVIAFNSLTGVLGQLRFVNIDWSLLAGFLVFAGCGVVAGIALAGRLADYRLRRVFATTVLFLAVAIAVGNVLPS